MTKMHAASLSELVRMALTAGILNEGSAPKTLMARISRLSGWVF